MQASSPPPSGFELACGLFVTYSPFASGVSRAADFLADVFFAVADFLAAAGRAADFLATLSVVIFGVSF